MSFQATNQTLSLTLPEIPYLTTYPLSVAIPTSILRTGMRLVIVIATYVLFRPHIEKLFRTLLNADDPAAAGKVSSKAELQERLKKLEQERGEPIGGGRKVGIVTGTQQQQQGSPSTTAAGGRARRKA